MDKYSALFFSTLCFYIYQLCSQILNFVFLWCKKQSRIDWLYLLIRILQVLLVLLIWGHFPVRVRTFVLHRRFDSVDKRLITAGLLPITRSTWRIGFWPGLAKDAVFARLSTAMGRLIAIVHSNQGILFVLDIDAHSFVLRRWLLKIACSLFAFFFAFFFRMQRCALVYRRIFAYRAVLFDYLIINEQRGISHLYRRGFHTLDLRHSRRPWFGDQ